MGKKRNRYLGGGVGALGSGAWGLYSNVTTIKDLPEDAGWIAKMIADPPVYAPWLLFIASVIFLAWVFWDRVSDENDPPNQSSNGPNSPNFGGDVTNSPMAFGGRASVMTGDDNRRGNFNYGTNYGGQHYHEEAKQRALSDAFLHEMAACPHKEVKIGTRAMNADYEMQTIEAQIVGALRHLGFDAFSQGYFAGGQMSPGTLVKYNADPASEALSKALQSALAKSGVNRVGRPESGSQMSHPFVLIEIGANV